jgi:citrate lyase subunit beta/citryl-CoA lyase
MRSTHSSIVAVARSFLFVPATRPERIAKALDSGADAVIVDLEDAVAPERKQEARTLVADVWPSLQGHERLCIRINGLGSSDYALDTALCARLKPAAVVVPKAESALALQSLFVHLDQSVALIPLIETARGWLDAQLIAQAAGVVRLAFGTLDFQVDMGMQCDSEESELAAVRLALTAVSRINGLASPIDGVTVALGDDERTKADTVRGRRFGFGAKFCIHPNQVGPVHEGFRPSAAELSWAKRVMDTVASEGSDAIKLDGRMIDRPMIELAKSHLRRGQ